MLIKYLELRYGKTHLKQLKNLEHVNRCQLTDNETRHVLILTRPNKLVDALVRVLKFETARTEAKYKLEG